ncbi:hypothetical protein [Anabaena sphaerica]|nr:hypothetical protein [Anabaena sphaerica]
MSKAFRDRYTSIPYADITITAGKIGINNDSDPTIFGVVNLTV